MSTETISFVREVDGRQVPVPGTWQIDPTHTTIEFIARHLMVTKVRGRFESFNGTLEINDDPYASSIAVDVDLDSVKSGTEDRDNHLRSADFFDIENFPQMKFRGSSFEKSGRGWTVHGELTIRDVTKPLSLDFEFVGVATDPWGNAKAAFTANGELDREDWGVTWNVPLEGGGVLVSKKVKLEIEAQAALQTDTQE